MLYALKNSTAKVQKAVLKTCPDDLIETIIEIVFNVLQGIHKVSPPTKRNLEKYKLDLRKIVCPIRSLDSKRKVLVQKGGAILPILLSTILSGLIGKFLQNA